LPVGRIYLLDNPLLRDPLLAEHVKPRLVGYWGTRLGLPVLYVTAAGHGGPGLVANAVFIAPMLSSRWV
jgi:xylulose-5-phosphate/fructose-6-phosphate phosphoketolase